MSLKTSFSLRYFKHRFSSNWSTQTILSTRSQIDWYCYIEWVITDSYKMNSNNKKSESFIIIVFLFDGQEHTSAGNNSSAIILIAYQTANRRRQQAITQT